MKHIVLCMLSYSCQQYLSIYCAFIVCCGGRDRQCVVGVCTQELTWHMSTVHNDLVFLLLVFSYHSLRNRWRDLWRVCISSLTYSQLTRSFSALVFFLQVVFIFCFFCSCSFHRSDSLFFRNWPIEERSWFIVNIRRLLEKLRQWASIRIIWNHKGKQWYVHTYPVYSSLCVYVCVCLSVCLSACLPACACVCVCVCVTKLWCHVYSLTFQ